MGTTINSCTSTLTPKSPIAALSSARNRITITPYMDVQVPRRQDVDERPSTCRLALKDFEFQSGSSRINSGTHMKKLLLGSFLLLFSNLAFAKWYQVEMVVFEHLTADDSGEFWNTGDVQDYSRAVELVTDTDAPNAFKMLPSSSYKLGGINKVLRLSRGYRPVHHVAWQQPELTKSKAKKVHIKDPEAKINGTVNLRGGHLLHLDLDISYFVDLFTESVISFTKENMSVASEDEEEIEVDEEIIMSGTYAQMKETRRIKLNELHYFDHPLFGVIMRVTRLEVEE